MTSKTSNPDFSEKRKCSLASFQTVSITEDEEERKSRNNTSSSSLRLPRVKEKMYKVDNPDVAKFLYGRTKQIKLKPLPDINQYKNDPFAKNPLLNFKLSAGKTKRIYAFLQEQAVRNKIKTYKDRSMLPKIEAVPKSQQECHRLLRQFGEAQPTVPLQESWVESIEKKLQGLHLRFPIIASAILEEVRENFKEEMHEFGVSLVVKPLPGHPVQVIQERKMDSGGKTARYPVYLRHRALVKSQLFLLDPLQRRIFRLAISTLPETLTDFRSYRSLGFLDIGTLKETVLADIKKGGHTISSSYYAKVVAVLGKKNNLKHVPQKHRSRFLISATNILRIQITNLMYRSIEHLLWLTEEEQRMPLLNMNLVCDDDLVLIPSQNEVYKTFHTFLDCLATVAQDLTPLETWVDRVTVPEGNITICINQPFLDESHAKLQKNLEHFLKDVNNYIDDLKQQHSQLYTGQRLHGLKLYIDEGHFFEELVEKRLEFQVYMENLSHLTVNEYFEVGRVCQYDLIKSLKELTGTFCNVLMNELLRIHAQENKDISNTFEELKQKALKDPESTEELMDMGVFMLGSSSAMVAGLEDRISVQLNKIAQLIHLTNVPRENISLMSATVNWILEIKPVFELNSSQYEQHKFEFEERLQKRTETLTKDLEELGPKLVVLNNMDDTTRIQEYLQEIRRFLGVLDSLDQDVLWINHEESLFKFPLSTYPELDELHKFINPFAKLLFLTYRWQWKHRVWMNGSFQDLDADVVEQTTEQFYKEFSEMQKMYKVKIKQQIQDNVARRFKGNVDDPDPNNIPVPIKICIKTLEQIKSFKMHVPLVKSLCNKALMQRHWDEMTLICGFDITPDFGTTLNKVVKMNVTPFLDQFEIISVGAGKELQLGQNLKAMWAEWHDIVFTISQWKESGLKILSDLDDIQALLDDHLVKTLTMRGSAFVKPFEEPVKEWYNLLDRVNKTIEEWSKVQVQWLYLIPIFSSQDIAAQMVEEAMLFRDVDSAFKRTMEATSRNPKVLDIAGGPGLCETFLKQIVILERINDGVNIYLEKKRLYFPRFFFLSNDEMLEILSETKDPLRVQPHLRKCFEGISKLSFDKDMNIGAMISNEGEGVKFTSVVSTRDAGGSVEKWLSQVESEMKASVQDSIFQSLLSYSKLPRTQWIQEWPGQVVICVSSIYWTYQVHHNLKSSKPGALAKYHQQLKEQLNDTVALVRGSLSKINRLTIGALIVIDVHAKDTVEILVKANLKSDSEFSWLAQMRYYWDNGQCLVKMVNATIKYAYEYLGNTPRLVITPLTDRCYRTLIGAYCLHLNGAPEGPAGTGKTETTKDLAKALAVQCIVFNCSDGLDYIAMGKFFKGLASSGAWACFDEFNRIELEVLSVVAQQILCVMRAVQAAAETFLFEGTLLTLNPACYVCITMNPGYAGRSELPDNLKVLFRTVAMMVPDYALIAEISLYSYGFDEARSLSIKIVTTYRLCSEQLSVQSHYDYGMRAVKTVLTAAGQLKLNYPDVDEHVLLLRAIVDVNRSKLLDQDVPLFEGIVMDMFPGITPMTPDYSALLEAMEKVCKARNLQYVEYFRNKVIETYEMMRVRHGFMLVGDPYGGKTSVLKVLADSLSEIGEPTDMVVINPKSVTMDQLYGHFDPVSYEWSDGILSIMFRGFIRDVKKSLKWLVLDGPVDAVWIENLNTVLDDNKKLCLNSGEVMVMTPEMSLVMEVMDLKQASPATVSRCGMIYLEPRALGWEVLAKSWIAVQDLLWMGDNSQMVWEIFKWVLPPALSFIQKNCQLLVPLGFSNMVASMLQLVRMLMTDACKNEPLYVTAWLQAAIVYGGVWGLAGALNSNSRVLFSTFYLELWRGNNEEHPIPESVGKIEVSLPYEGNLFDCVYAFKSKGNWRQCADIMKQEKLEEPLNLAQMLVPTVDTVKYSALIELHIQNNAPILLVGKTGTGKTFMTQNILMTKIDQDHFIPAFVTFTVSTTANDTQKLIISKLNKRKRGVFGPPKGQHCIFLIDDVNMPAKEVYGAQPAIELLRQYLDTGHWYDVKSGGTLKLADVLFLSAMGLPGGSRQDVTARFLRHFNVIAVNEASEESMVRIFSAVLFAGLKRNGFATDAMTAVTSIVNSTLDVYTSSLSELRPTPTKSHYLFNIRDFARVIQGCALIKKESVDSKKVFSKLWVHETLRVFYDRLIDDKDKAWMFEKLRICIKDHMKDNFDSVFDGLKLEDGICTETSLRDLMFASYLDLDALENDRKYEELSSINQLLEIASDVIEEYNSSHNDKIDLVLFRYALEHLNRICRILTLPGGSGLLVGVSGSGRQCLTRLATAMLGYSFFQPEITASYALVDWRNDMKKILKDSGGRGKPTTFLFSESQIKDEAFLYDIDALLNLGEVPELFAIDEKQEILELVRLSAQGGNRNLDISPLTVFNFFVARCKQKLHMLLCFSPIGSGFRNRIRLYSSLVNCCTIDWFVDWPVEALEMVANRLMTDLYLPHKVKTSAVTAAKYYHTTAQQLSTDFFNKTQRITYITSSAFLELISTFAKLTTKTQEETLTSKEKYVGGLDKLQYAADQVTAMSKELSDLKPKLEVAKSQTVEMMLIIEEEKKKVEAAADLVKKDEQVANEQAAASLALKAECEADLAQAIPILEEAIAALNTLKPTDITLVKSMKNPPDAVKLVMAAVCVMKDAKPDKQLDPSTGRKVLDYWGPSKRLLGDMAFLQQLKEYDKDNISPEIMVKIRKEYIPHKDFKPQVVAKASSAAEGLCKWVIAMDLYDAVAKEVAPKKAKLEVAEAALAATMFILNAKRAEVSALEGQLAELMQKLEETQEKKMRLEEDVAVCANKLFRAEKLIDGLGGEKSRWEAAAMQLQANYDAIAGDILISCGVIAYLSPFTLAYRQEVIKDWYSKCLELDIPCSSSYSFTKVLGSEVKIQSWNIFGLPSDDYSTENAIILHSSEKWPLLVDPQEQANKWIKAMEKANNLEVVKITDTNYMSIVIDCITYGKPVLIENIMETLDTALNPILTRNIFQKHGQWHISLRDDVIEYNLNFKLYLTSNLRNPHFQPAICNKVRIINFALTLVGLEDQLLGIVVAKERPDLQAKRQELIVKNARNRQALLEVEGMILQTLSSSKGNILEDENAVETLDSSKILSQNIKIEQESVKETETVIESFRSSYRPIAAHSAVLYYCIADLVNVDPMYLYSLNWFITLFHSSINSANKSKDLQKRLQFLRDTFTFDLYSNVCRSLFEKDKLLFSFILCCNVLMAEGKLEKSEYMFFLTGGAGLPSSTSTPNPASDWLRDKSWEELERLSQFSAFEGISEDVNSRIQEWKKFYDLENPTFHEIPQPWSETLTSFQSLLLVRILRLDKIIPNVNLFVNTEMGVKFVKPPSFDLVKSYGDSNCLCPLIFILSPGSDPMGSLTAFAEKMGMVDKFESVSLGQGQGPLAAKLIAEAQVEGSWVCLQNCHLAVSWLPTLEKIWESMDLSNTSLTFRLWLTSYPSADFPTRILQNSVKMTNEAPTGLQPNILRSLTSYPVNDSSFFNGCPGKNKIFGKLLYGMAFFHAVLQERKKFGAIGWNIPYGFDDSDFQISIKQLQTFIIDYAETPYEAITYLTGECNYGGRVTDDWDRRVLTTILSEFINKKVATLPKYTFAPGNCYGLPRQTGYQDYLNYVMNIPIDPSPEVLGLHANAGITQGQQGAKKLLESAILVEGSGYQASGKSEQLLLETARNIFQKIPENYNVEQALLRYPISYSESMNALLVQEMERFNILLDVIRKSLGELENAVLGFVVMSPELEGLAVSLQNMQIPMVWRKASYPSLKSLGPYIADLHERLNFFQQWYEKGKPSTFWVSGFYSTHGFLTGVMQNFARKYAISIDLLTFDFEVQTDKIPEAIPVDGALLFGLFVDGARWDRENNRLEELYRTVLYDKLPLVWLKPIRKTDLVENARYKCPLYKTLERRGTLSTTGISTNFVIPVLLETELPPAHWIKRGVALICQLDD